jgi:hypothetical protein
MAGTTGTTEGCSIERSLIVANETRWSVEASSLRVSGVSSNACANSAVEAVLLRNRFLSSGQVSSGQSARSHFGCEFQAAIVASNGARRKDR